MQGRAGHPRLGPNPQPEVGALVLTRHRLLEERRSVHGCTGKEPAPAGSVHHERERVRVSARLGELPRLRQQRRDLLLREPGADGLPAVAAPVRAIVEQVVIDAGVLHDLAARAQQLDQVPLHVEGTEVVVIDAHAVAAAIHGQRVCSGADATLTPEYIARMNKPIQSN